MENAVVYARYSSHNQSEQSIEGQLAAAHKYAESKNYAIVGEYCDRAKTGTNDNREAFQKMLSDLKKHSFSVIIVWKVDRFGRNREEITFNKHKCKKYGVRVEYVAENITDGPEGVILESVLEGMAEYYSLQLSQNVKRGQLEAAKKHHVLSGQITYGYRTAADKTYEIDPETAPIVRTLFEKYASGYTLSELQEWLKSTSLRTRTGKIPSKQSLAKMLKNERYIGVYLFKNIIREENVIPPIIDKETFNRVQYLLKQNRRMPSHRWSYSEYPLTGKLYCACGSPMTGESGHNRYGTKYHYYKCLNKKRNNACKMKPVRQNYLDDLVIEKAIATLTNKNIIDRLSEFVHGRVNHERSNIHYFQSRRLSEVTAAIANLIASVEAGMPYELVRTRLDELRKEEASLRNSQAPPQEYSLSQIQFFIKQYVDRGFDNTTCNRGVVEALVNRVEIHEDRLVVALNYSSDQRSIKCVRMCSELQAIDDNSRTFLQDNVIIIEISRV